MKRSISCAFALPKLKFKMPKKGAPQAPKSPPVQEAVPGCVFNDKKGNLNIKVLAKPGAKTNQITSITDEGVGVQINAPPVDGEANSMLIKFFSGLLNIRKSDINLDKGVRSRQKTLQLSPGVMSSEDVLRKLKDAAEK